MLLGNWLAKRWIRLRSYERRMAETREHPALLLLQHCQFARLCQQETMDRLAADHEPTFLRCVRYCTTAPPSNSWFFTLTCSEARVSDTLRALGHVARHHAAHLDVALAGRPSTRRGSRASRIQTSSPAGRSSARGGQLKFQKGSFDCANIWRTDTIADMIL